MSPTVETSDGHQVAELRFVTIPDPNMAIGLAVRFMADKPAYAAVPFQQWASALIGQINRGHYGFVLTRDDEVVGFIGWALASEEKADGWLHQRLALRDEDCREGDCVIFNAFVAKTKPIQHFIWDAVRAATLEKKALYYRRAYPDGRVRPVRIPVTEFFETRVARAEPRYGGAENTDDDVVVLSIE